MRLIALARAGLKQQSETLASRVGTQHLSINYNQQIKCNGQMLRLIGSYVRIETCQRFESFEILLSLSKSLRSHPVVVCKATYKLSPKWLLSR